MRPRTRRLTLPIAAALFVAAGCGGSIPPATPATPDVTLSAVPEPTAAPEPLARPRPRLRLSDTRAVIDELRARIAADPDGRRRAARPGPRPRPARPRDRRPIPLCAGRGGLARGARAGAGRHPRDRRAGGTPARASPVRRRPRDGSRRRWRPSRTTRPPMASWWTRSSSSGGTTRRPTRPSAWSTLVARTCRRWPACRTCGSCTATCAGALAIMRDAAAAPGLAPENTAYVTALVGNLEVASGDPARPPRLVRRCPCPRPGARAVDRRARPAGRRPGRPRRGPTTVRAGGRDPAAARVRDRPRRGPGGGR